MTARDPFQLVGTTIAGKYRVDRVIGEGGCGIVYAGLHVVVGAPVAIKCLKPLGGDRALEQHVTELFLREAQVLFGLTHPGIVRLYDTGVLEHGGQPVPWVVLEYIEGVTLEDELTRRAREGRHLDRAELVALFDPVLDAVAFAHGSGVAHRDLKPSNVMLQRTARGELLPKVVDFGIARRLGDRQRTQGGLTGFTPRYAAPEQWDAALGATGPASDVYSLGLMLVEACTLRPALGGQGAAAIVSAVLDPTRRPCVIEGRADLGPAIDHVVARATRTRREDRFADAREMQQAFRAALGGPTSIAPSGPVISAHAASLEGLPRVPTALAPPPFMRSSPPGVDPGLAGLATVPSAHAPPARSNSLLLVAIVALLGVIAVIGVALVVVLGRAPTEPPKAATNATTAKHATKPAAASAADDDDELASPAPKKKHPQAPAGDPTAKLVQILGPEFYSEGQILAVFEKQREGVLGCYREALAADPYIGGQMTVIVDVTPAGRVEAPTGASGSGSESFHSCVAAKITEWRFPRPYPKAEDDFILTLEFHP